MSLLRAFSLATRQRLLFAFLCFVWGTTWLAMKIGIDVVPPAFFSGVRWTVAGIALLGWQRFRHAPIGVSPRLLGRLVVLSLFMISLNATIQLYGLRLVTTGMAAVINSGLTPIGMLGFAVALRQERLTWRQTVAIVIGISGLLVLFGLGAPAGHMDWWEILGIILVVVSTLSYCGGSVLSRPLLRTMAPVHLAGITNLIGGIVLLVLSLPLEPGAWQAAGMAWGWRAWVGWCWLVFAGSLGASIIFFILMRDWGASRTGTYAFVTPVIAVLLGVVVLGERVDATEALGMALMLVGAGLGSTAGRRKRSGAATPEPGPPAPVRGRPLS